MNCLTWSLKILLHLQKLLATGLKIDALQKSPLTPLFRVKIHVIGCTLLQPVSPVSAQSREDTTHAKNCMFIMMFCIAADCRKIDSNNLLNWVKLMYKLNDILFLVKF